MAASPEGDPAATPERRIVTVMGPGRSGTSTVSGALVRCGLEVPGRAIRGNPTNPSGFYEPRWVVDFHRKYLERWHVQALDTSPGARQTVINGVARNPAVRSELRDWLAEELDHKPQLVVKDPRGIWFHDLWADVMRELEVRPGFITMLRHPAEVAASRHKSYRNAEKPPTRSLEIRRAAGWINSVLSAESMTRGFPRVWIHYSDLLTDWRSALGRISDRLDLTYDPPVGAEPHPIDEFIDPRLRSVSADRPELDLPPDLRELGEDVWETMTRLAASGDSPGALDDLDQLRRRYGRLTKDAAALIQDGSNRQRHRIKRRARAAGVREGRAQATAAEDEPALRRIIQRFVKPGK